MQTGTGGGKMAAMYLPWSLVLLVAALSAQEPPPPELPMSLPAEPLPARPEGAPLFTFGVVADIQYADKDSAGTRRYREATGKLAECVAAWNGEQLAFTIQLGDIVDGYADRARSLADLDRVLEVLGGLEHPVRHVVGNHCLTVGRETLLERLGMDRAYYDFVVAGWRFVVLDGMDINVLADDPSPAQRRRVQEFLDAHPRARERVAVRYNGGVGAEQAAWLERTLTAADAAGERAIVFCHLPVLAEAADAGLLLWNHEEIAALLARHASVAAFFCGHHHAGGYARADGVHHVTLHGLVDAPTGGNSFAFVDVYPAWLEIRGVGRTPSWSLPVRDPWGVRLRVVGSGAVQRVDPVDGGLEAAAPLVHWELEGERLTTLGEVEAALRNRAARRSDPDGALPALRIECARGVSYGHVAATVAAVRAAGFARIQLATPGRVATDPPRVAARGDRR
ncbi:MAG: metallophosphoesterase [Planctomycetes bacterium]|nr:metallophosphoesterase [Planctomycetota bacterium]